MANDIRELVLFRVDDMLCGLDIQSIQEINKNMEITPVYMAPDYVQGVINLRGEIVTIVDVRLKFGIPRGTLSKKNKNIIVQSQGECVGLLVDEVDDIVEADAQRIQPPPSHLKGALGQYFVGVYELENELVAIMDVDKLLAVGEYS